MFKSSIYCIVSFIVVAGICQEATGQRATSDKDANFLGTIEGYKAVKAFEKELYQAITSNDIDFIYDRFADQNFINKEALTGTLRTISKAMNNEALNYKWYYSRQRDRKDATITLGYKWIDAREIIQYVVEADLAYPDDQIEITTLRILSFDEYQIQKMFPGGNLDRVAPPMIDPPKIGN